jgi:hypothetical protein
MTKKKLTHANHNNPQSPEEIEELIENGAKAYEAYLDAKLKELLASL